ncbi:MAG: PorP/SprF family type IX secretion system membrane protein [Bacteroidota bacterium]
MRAIQLLALALLLFVGISTVQAQQLSLFTQYREHNTVINPAAISSDFLAFGHNASFGLSYRLQWAEYAGSPRTQLLRGEYMTTDYNVNLLVGGHIMRDQAGAFGSTGIYGRLAGIISGDPEYSGLSLGLSVGAVQYSVLTGDLRVRDEGDILAVANQSQMHPDVGVGIYAYTYLDAGPDGGYLYGGISVPQAIGLDLNFTDENENFQIKRIQHVFANIGLMSFLRDDNFIEPSIWLKYVPGAPINADFNIRYQFSENLWIGTGMSTAKNAHIEAGLLVGDVISYGRNLKIGYGFDYSFTSFGPTVGATHEINIAFAFAN